MKKSITVFVFATVLFCSFAGQFNTVPLGHEVYNIIDSAEIRGIIATQLDAKPYDYRTVRDLLSEIAESDQVTDEELDVLLRVCKNLDRTYDSQPKNIEDFLRNGLYRWSSEDTLTNVTVGIKGKMYETGGLDFDKNKIMDLRNRGTLYFAGDLGNCLSYDMNATLMLDSLNPRAYLTEEFLYDADGDYFLGAGCYSGTTHNKFKAKNDGIHLGFTASPEITASFFKNKLQLRLGSFKRDWGPGKNNLILSESALPFYGFEFYVKPKRWINFSILTGTMTPAYAKKLYGVERPGAESILVGTSSTDYDVSYANALSIQRVELINKKGNFKFGLFESVMWKRRFEIAYLHPFSIYWFAQSLTGDVDNVVGGADFTWDIPKLGRFYGAISVDEFTKDIKHIVSAARNIMAIQGGFEFNGKLLGSFSSFRIQGTYIPPFYGTHKYIVPSNRSYSETYSVAYTNRGFNLFYPMNPDSLEVLVGCNMFLKKGWNISFLLRDQMRSAQYACSSYNGGSNYAAGTNIFTVIDYDGSDDYERKHFFKYIWNNILDLNITFTKNAENFPLSLTIGGDIIFDWSRNYTVGELKNYSNGSNNYSYNSQYNDGTATKMGSWNSPDIRVLAHVGFSLYY